MRGDPDRLGLGADHGHRARTPGRRQRLPLSQVAEVAALDKAQTRALRGPRADPAAYLLVRPYRPCAVYVEIDGRPPERPYWLVATRKPARLAQAIELARSAAPGADHAEEYRVARPSSDAVG